MNRHIRKILETVHRLKAISGEINNSHISEPFCAHYDTLITALESRLKDELNPKFIRGKLVVKYNRRLENSEKPQRNSI